ncbi:MULTISPECIES: cell wall-binding repeat-containing protein [Clostridium]|uniref:N-acetylmuramoyl-L-alanine amidase LytC n=3 Tax=Clostridium TaxID=1485 RepID=D8GNP6_CLOLD|nr:MULTISPECIES: cell wall-binding repeat-containing protein [Clostridium]ADK15909.1 putative cell wall binding protein [Clostridium ljungdahlii DSM 13528]AGY75083.1 cell wall-binding repeat-containing protein [Clostridium autoethanogenum DSM 10061]ALU35255.1 Cell wall binding repeat 2-containing protein [Clostridium autoethanogenum DSM 10061]OAA87213.1 N-acetylmuramoyl-L-alanine amidase LytC precursor [Clostridium ljungdahlii DSM 13528]OVY49666.1 N-acetylmuramoyl-L-alanine amidase LytC precur
MRKKLISLLSVFMFVFIFFGVRASAASPESIRLGGQDRYGTCSQIVNQGWKSSNYAVIVNGYNFPDALSAATLAKKYNAPILLNGSDRLENTTIEQIKRLSVKQVFIVGGTGVISNEVEDELHGMNISTERFSGLNRTETSVSVANQIGTSNGIILTTDSDYTDALSIASIAAKLQMPIILVPKDSVPDSVSQLVENKNIPVTYVLGGQDIISDAVSSKFPNVKRISGSDKYERNINIINAFSDKFDFSSICLAYSEDFADALSGSAFAALNSNPIVLVGSSTAPVTQCFIENKSFSKLYVFGGEAGITGDIVATLTNGKTSDKPQPSPEPQPQPQPAPADPSSEPTTPTDTSASHSELQKNLYNYLSDEDHRQSVLSRAIELHGGDTSNNCVYFQSEALRRSGLTDLPEWVCNTVQFTSQLLQRGWTKCEDLAQLRPGDICFTTNGPSHTYTFMKWCDPKSYDYAYICDNQGNEYGGNAYHKRNVDFATSLKDAIAYFMYEN